MVIMVAALGLAGCRKSADDGGSARAPSPNDPPKPVGEPLELVVVYGSEKKTWFEEAARAFESGGAATKAGRPIKVVGKPMGSGEAAQAILDGSIKAHVFSPASGAYITLLNETWLATGSHTRPLCPAGEPLVLSPIVIAMWKPMAEAMGWPDKDIGWADIIKISRDKRGFGALGHPEWGAFKLGHTHPEYSNSGLLAVLAEAFAGAGKQRDLTAADLDQPKTQAFLAAVEEAVVHYGKSTGFFADKMLERGPSYLSAAVLYENLVIESYGKPSDAGMPLVAVYPVEGTFWSDHPFAVLDADWVTADEREAAALLLAFLKAKPQQERALALGFRPGDPSIPVSAPIDAAHGVDPKQPQTLLEVPSGATLKALLALWHKVKKPTDVVLVFDKSGSMRGRPLVEAKSGAKAFLDGLHDRDQVVLLFFDDKLYDPPPARPLGEARRDLQTRIDGTIAEGGTALYDATNRAYDLALARAKQFPARIHAIVVMTDGRDENSSMALGQLKTRFTPENAPVKIFTIAYGEGADPTVLADIAEAAQGQAMKGTADTIVQVYRDVSAFF